MRYAIFSDIHNNTAALAAVLRDAARQEIDAYFCLGDVGIDDCVDRVRQVNAVTVFGNWEVSGWRYLSSENQAWTLALPPLRREPQFWLTHAAPLWPPRLTTLADFKTDRHAVPMAKLFPYLHHESEALWETIATLTEAEIPLMFHGHTHRQLSWRFSDDNQLQKTHARLISPQPGETWIIGVGSVGRPLDGPMASYAIYDDRTREITLNRV